MQRWPASSYAGFRLGRLPADEEQVALAVRGEQLADRYLNRCPPCSGSGRAPVLVNEPAEDVDAFDPPGRPRCYDRRRCGLRHGEVEAAVRPGGVVPQVGAQHTVEV